MAKLGAILITCVLSEDEVDGTSLLSVRGVVQSRTTPPEEFKYSGGDASKAVWQCPDGSSHISSHDQCLRACASLGAFVGKGKNWAFQTAKADWNWPNGCYQRTDTSPSAVKKICLWNVHDESAAPPPTIHKNYDATKSICRIDPSTDQSIVVIGTTSHLNWANSNGNFYIKFSGDDTEYSLYSGGDDFVKGKTDTWPLSVKAGADLTKPTIFIKEHIDAWIPSSIVIKKGPAEVFNANGLPAIIDGNCKKEGLQWGNLFCAKSMTFPFKEVSVTVKTGSTTHANSNGNFYMSFFGDHRQYVLPGRHHFGLGGTDSFPLFVANAVNLDETMILRSGSNDGLVPTEINVNGKELSPRNHQSPVRGDGVAHQFPVWLDGDCPKSGLQATVYTSRRRWTIRRRRRGVPEAGSKERPCRKVWELELK